MSVWKLSYFRSFLVSAFLLCACQGEVARTGAGTQRDSLRDHEATQSIVLRGTTYRIPAAYPVLVQRERMPAFIFFVEWPDMAGLNSENLARLPEHEGYTLQIHVVGESFENPSLTAEQSLSTIVSIRMISSVGPTEELATEFGLVEHRAVGMRPGFADNGGRNDYYRPVDGSEVHIWCASQLSGARIEPSRAPCSQQWVHRRSNVKVFYRRHLLPEWRQIVENTDQLIDSFAEPEG